MQTFLFPVIAQARVQSKTAVHLSPAGGTVSSGVPHTNSTLALWRSDYTVAVRKRDCPSKCDDCCLLTVMWIGSHLRSSQKLVGGISNCESTVPLKHMLILSRIVSSRIIANVSSWWVSTQIKHFCIVLVRHLQSTDKLWMCIKCQSDTLVSTFPALSTFTVAAVCSLKQCSECRSHLNLYAESRVRQFTFTSQQTSSGKKMVLIFFSIQFWSSAEKKS